jgi:hypothetical protein
MFTRLGDVLLQLYLQHKVHGSAKSFFEAERHFGRRAGAATENGAQGRAAYAQNFRGLGDVKASFGQYIFFEDFMGARAVEHAVHPHQ